MDARRERVLRWAGLGLLAAAVAAFGHVCAVKGGDFTAFYDAAEASARRGDIYALGPRMGMNVPYVPYFALVLMPLALVPPYVAAWIWYVLKLGALAYLARWLGRAVRVEAPALVPRARAAYLVLPFLAALNPFMSEFRLGQANLFVLFFSVLTIEALERRRPFWGALFFSLAAVKVTALALLPWFALRRQWRFFVAALPVGALWIGALAAWWGPSAVAGLFSEWIRTTAARRGGFEAVAYYENQSLQGAAARLASVVPALQRPVLGLAPHQWLWILGCAAVVVLLGVVAARDGFRARLPAEEFAVGSLLMLLASSDSRYAHHVQLFVPLAVLTLLSARIRWLESLPRLGPWLSGGGPTPAPAVRLRRWLAVLWGATFAFYVALGRDTFGPTINHAARALSLGTALDLALLVFLAVRLLRGSAAPEGAEVRWLAADTAAGRTP